MDEISNLKYRVDNLIAREQETQSFIHHELVNFSLNILDVKFQKYIKTHYSNKYLSALRLGQFTLGLGLVLAKKANKDVIQKSVDDINEDTRKKEILDSMQDIANQKIISLDLEKIYRLIPILKTGTLKQILNHLDISTGFLV